MELRHIEAFLKVVEFRNMTKAAEALYITQSTVSYRIKMLETELDDVLVLRKKGNPNITLTARGAEFVPIAKLWLEVYQKTCAFRTASKVLTIRIAAPESLNYLLRRQYTRLCQQIPNLKLSIMTSESRRIPELLMQNQIDIGLCYMYDKSAGIHVQEIGRMPMVLLEYAKEKRKGERIDPAELDPELAIAVTGLNLSTPETVDYFAKLFSRVKQHAIQVDSPFLQINMMRQGSWSIIPSAWVELLPEDDMLHVYDLPETAPELVYYKMISDDAERSVTQIFGEYF